MTDSTDESSEALFQRWLVEHRGTVSKVARAYTLTVEEHQDLAQEILLQVWRSLPQFRGESNATTWFYRVALNTAIGWHRKERLRRTNHQPPVDFAEPQSVEPDSTELATHRETVERLYVAIRRLSKTDVALVLLYLDGLSHSQIADVLGISVGHVGVKLHRAKTALADMLKEAGDDQ